MYFSRYPAVMRLSRDWSSSSHGKVPAMVGSIVVVGAQQRCLLLHSVYNLKAVQTNRKRCLIQDLVLYEFDPGYNVAESIKDIRCVKGEGAIDHSTATRLLKKLHSGGKNLTEQAKWGRPKSVDSEAVPHAIEVNLASSTWRVSGEHSMSLSSVSRLLYHLNKNYEAAELYLTLKRYWKTFDSP